MADQCKAITAAGTRCKRAAVPHLTVCSVHGGGTPSAQKTSRTREVKSRLWQQSPEAEVDTDNELRHLLSTLCLDISAIRRELSAHPEQSYGMLTDTVVEASSQDVSGVRRKTISRLRTHPLVDELHSREETLRKLLELDIRTRQDTQEQDMKTLTSRIARHMAHVMRAWPGISPEDAAKEVTRDLE